MINKSEEDYIKVIYELTVERKQTLIMSTEISEHFGYSDQSVNEMIKRLENKQLVSFIPYKGISLTEEGNKVAIRMIRAHRIWEVFLGEKLNFPWENLHQDAEMLEHATSPELLEKLYHFLGEPKYCQQGNPIPDLEGNTEQSDHLRLADAHENDKFKITRVLDNKELLVFLNQKHIKLYDVFLITKIDSFNQIIQIEGKNEEHLLSLNIAKMLFGNIVV